MGNVSELNQINIEREVEQRMDSAYEANSNLLLYKSDLQKIFRNAIRENTDWKPEPQDDECGGINKCGININIGSYTYGVTVEFWKVPGQGISDDEFIEAILDIFKMLSCKKYIKRTESVVDKNNTIVSIVLEFGTL